MVYSKRIAERAVYFLRKRLPAPPQIALVLGSGLDGIMTDAEIEQEVAYEDIPGFHPVSVAGHTGRLTYCKMNGTRILVLRGRWHYYEGYDMQDVTFYVRVLRALGLHTLVLTNASGGVNPAYQPGDVMLITDHINLMPNPLLGPNDDELGPRFPTMHQAYAPEFFTIAREVARQEQILLQEGCYLGTTGPSFETPHEYNFYRIVGADAVGMSTVPEVIVANHCGLKVLAFSMISNVGGLDRQKEVSHQEVQEVGAVASEKLIRLLWGIFPQIENAKS